MGKKSRTAKSKPSSVKEESLPNTEESLPNAEKSLPSPAALLTTSEDEMLQKLGQLEALLQKQNAFSQKMLFWRRISSGLTLALVTVAVVVSVQVVTMLQTNLEGMPELIENTNALVTQAGDVDFESLNEGIVRLNAGISQIDFEALSEGINQLDAGISEIDFEALNEGITQLDEGVSEIDFAALNEVIVNLEAVSERLDAATGFFG